MVAAAAAAAALDPTQTAAELQHELAAKIMKQQVYTDTAETDSLLCSQLPAPAALPTAADTAAAAAAAAAANQAANQAADQAAPNEAAVNPKP